MKRRPTTIGWLLLALAIVAALVVFGLRRKSPPGSPPVKQAMASSPAHPAATPQPVADAQPAAIPASSAQSSASISASGPIGAPAKDANAPVKASSIADVLTPGVDLSDPAQRAAAVGKLRAAEALQKAAAIARADKMGIAKRIERPDGTVVELMGFDGDKPVYFITHNANAAISTGANLVQAAPYNAVGTGVTVGEWDGGGVRTTHQEFGARVTIKDGAALLDHSTHVGGTIAAAGVVAAAKGMAPAARIDSYEWNSDKSEMTARGATYPGETGMLYLSNHSYGQVSGWYFTGLSSPEWAWYGTGTTSTGVENDFGKYETNARDSDALAASLPYFLMFRSAGNERIDNPSAGDPVSLTTSTSGSVVAYNPAQHPAGDGVYKGGGYDTIGFDAGAKDVMTVGAVNDAVGGGLRSVVAGTMTTFSSWGPTDDGRIKPDIVANGSALYSSLATGDADYGTFSGTSMASPNAVGSAALLVEYFNRLFPGHEMRASTLKALLIHTADDEGSAGPDYAYGWGLINVKAAADVIQRYRTSEGTRALVEDRVTTSLTSRSYTFTWDGVSPICATLCWIDPAGTATTTADSRTARLVNNLDLRVNGPGGTVHQPYVMPYVGDWSVAKLSATATTGQNNVDNVEQVAIASPPAAGVYTAVVTFTGALTGGAQNFSLILTGGVSADAAAPTVAAITPASGSSGTTVVTVSGGNFALGANVKLTRTGQPDVAASGQEVTADAIKCRVVLDGMAAGHWNVVVMNPDGQSVTLANAFAVTAPLWSEAFESGGAGWTHSASVGTTSNWALSTLQSHSAGHSMLATASAARNVDDLYSPPINIPAGTSDLRLTFWHFNTFTSTRSGGVLEFSIDGGATWFDVTSASSGASFATGGYTGTLSTAGTSTTRNPLAGQSAWTGSATGFTQVAVDLTDSAKYAGKTLRMRWRFATGQVSGNASRWYVDDVVLAGSVPEANLAPSITTAASATPSAVTGTTSLLHVVATDDAGEGSLTYTWTATGDFGASVQFSDNADHSASTTTATFAKAGSYVVSVTVRDAEGLSTSSDAAVTVAQAASQIVVTPVGESVAKGATQQFAAQENDQFGAAMAAQPAFAWSASGGVVDAVGLFTAGNATGNFTITADDGALSGSTGVTVTGERLETWRAAHFSVGEDSGDNADFDGDGLTNLLEYALGTDPRVRNGEPAAALQSGALTLSFQRPRALPDVDYAVEVSGDLDTWAVLPLEIVTDGEVQTMRAVDTVPASGAAQRFIRLKVSPVP